MITLSWLLVLLIAVAFLALEVIAIRNSGRNTPF